jgi:quercetin dioxygenase-like cupin family protein
MRGCATAQPVSEVAYRVLNSRDAFWRPSNQMRVENTDLATQLEAQTLAARLWRLQPGQASTKHRHFDTHELYVLIEGTGRIRVDDEVVTVEPLSAVLVEPEHVRQVFNDTEADALWLIASAPREEITSTLEMSDEQLAFMYPDGPKALPPELGGGQLDP